VAGAKEKIDLKLTEAKEKFDEVFFSFSPFQNYKVL
jgi:hypothetical protein